VVIEPPARIVGIMLNPCAMNWQRIDKETSNLPLAAQLKLPSSPTLLELEQ
jgi:hypothetical protein